jgi:hypothetical protein
MAIYLYLSVLSNIAQQFLTVPLRSPKRKREKENTGNYTGKKENKIFLKYKKIHKGVVAKVIND